MKKYIVYGKWSGWCGEYDNKRIALLSIEKLKEMDKDEDIQDEYYIEEELFEEDEWL